MGPVDDHLSRPGSNWCRCAHVTPVLLALIAAVQSIVATLAMAYVRIRTHPGATIADSTSADDPAPA